MALVLFTKTNISNISTSFSSFRLIAVPSLGYFTRNQGYSFQMHHVQRSSLNGILRLWIATWGGMTWWLDNELELVVRDAMDSGWRRALCLRCRKELDRWVSSCGSGGALASAYEHSHSVRFKFPLVFALWCLNSLALFLLCVLALALALQFTYTMASDRANSSLPAYVPSPVEIKYYLYGLPSKPRMIARSSTDVWMKPTGPESYLEPKELRILGAYPLNAIWEDIVGPAMDSYLLEQRVQCTLMHPPLSRHSWSACPLLLLSSW